MTVPRLDPTAAAEYFFAGAHNAGLEHVVVSPGSRSTPLSIAVSRSPGLTYSVELDERVAAFVALGRAKASGRPVGLVCTSGTAAANYLPAVAEASMSNIPLVVITADRPPEHQRWGVGQSFDQRGLYQRQVRDEITMPVGADAGVAHAQRAGWRATATAVERHGPVHVNWPFRMPLEPTAAPIEPPAPLSAVPSSSPEPNAEQITLLANALSASQRPVIIAGPDASRGAAQETGEASLVEFAARHSIPVLADVLSGVGRGPGGPVVPAHAFLAHAKAPAPDLVVHVGQTPTAKSLRLWWEQLDCAHLLIDPLDEWQDASHLVTERIRSAPEPTLAAASPLIDQSWDAGWLDTWTALGKGVTNATNDVLDGWGGYTEAHIARSLGATATALDRIVASSSMPVRDLDSFAASTPARVYANRGINGIDGVVSTAAGIHSTATSGRTFVVIGDVAALHDVGGILSAARRNSALTIVVPNNDGGGIFSFLPVVESIDADLFAELFHTPHGTSFGFLAGHENIHHEFTTDLEAAIASSAGREGISILEVSVKTPDRLALQESITSAVEGLPR